VPNIDGQSVYPYLVSAQHVKCVDFMSTGNVSAANFQTGWTSYASESNLLQASGFTLSNIGVNRAVYCIIGPLCFFEVNFTFQTSDCGAGDYLLYIKVPSALRIANGYAEAAGRFSANGGLSQAAFLFYAGTTGLHFRKYDSSDWVDTASANNTVAASGFFTWTTP